MKKTEKILLVTPAVAILLLTVSTFSRAAELSGDLTFTSDYAFRGISQTDEAPAIQGGLTLSADNGWYATVWGSNVDFGGQGTLELDILLGWSGEINSDWSADVGVMRYGYPNTEFSGSNFYELYGSLSYQALTLGLAYSDDYYANVGDYIYLYANYSYTLSDNWTIDVHVGQNEYENGSDSYLDWSIAVSTEMLETGVSLSYVDTDINDCNLCDSRIILTVSKSF